MSFRLFSCSNHLLSLSLLTKQTRTFVLVVWLIFFIFVVFFHYDNPFFKTIIVSKLTICDFAFLIYLLSNFFL